MSTPDSVDLGEASQREDLATTSKGLNIVLAMHCEPGHSNASFGLAKRLRDRGHKVTYLGLMDARRTVTEQGFEFVSFAEDILPEGATRNSGEPPGGLRMNMLRWRQRRRANEQLFGEFLRRLSNGHLDQRLLSCKPDLLLSDTCVWYVALRAIFLGIPTVNIATSLCSHPNPDIPPLLSSRIPKASWSGRMQVRADWLWLRCQFLFTKRLASILLGRFRSPSRMHHLTDEFLSLARRSGVGCSENRTYRFSEIGPRLVLPEIVLPPNSLDFPHAPNSERRYLGDFADLSRKEDPTLLGKLNTEKPLVYCSLGSASRFYPHSGHFFQTVVAAGSLRRDWQWVLSVGTQQEVKGLSDPDSNLLIVKWAPQLALLQRAAVMVTHGGINSIVECIHFAVPMVIVPGARDQPGNMARAVHHGIAVPGSMKDITAEQLVKLIEDAMHDTDLRQAMSRMKARVAAEPGMEGAVEMIEAVGRLDARYVSRDRRHEETTQPLKVSSGGVDR